MFRPKISWVRLYVLKVFSKEKTLKIIPFWKCTNFVKFYSHRDHTCPLNSIRRRTKTTYSTIFKPERTSEIWLDLWTRSKCWSHCLVTVLSIDVYNCVYNLVKFNIKHLENRIWSFEIVWIDFLLSQTSTWEHTIRVVRFRFVIRSNNSKSLSNLHETILTLFRF